MSRSCLKTSLWAAALALCAAAAWTLAACGSESTPTDLPARTTAVAAYAFPAQEPYEGFAYAHNTNGIEFVPQVDIEATELGYYDDGGDGLLNHHTMGIFATSSQQLVTDAVTVDRESTLEDGFRYETITPVVLKAGQSYVLAGETCAPFDPMVVDPEGIVWAPEVRFVDLRSITVPGKDFVFPRREEPHFMGELYGVVNFKFRTPASPEPAATP